MNFDNIKLGQATVEFAAIDLDDYSGYLDDYDTSVACQQDYFSFTDSDGYHTQRMCGCVGIGPY